MQAPDPRALCMSVLTARADAVAMFERCQQALKEAKEDLEGVATTLTLRSQISELEQRLDRTETAKRHLEAGLNMMDRESVTESNDHEHDLLRAMVTGLESDLVIQAREFTRQTDALRCELERAKKALHQCQQELDSVAANTDGSGCLHATDSDIESEMNLRLALNNAESVIKTQRLEIATLKSEFDDGNQHLFEVRAKCGHFERESRKKDSTIAEERRRRKEAEKDLEHAVTRMRGKSFNFA